MYAVTYCIERCIVRSSARSSNEETILATLRHLKYRGVSCRMKWEEVIKLLVERQGWENVCVVYCCLSFKDYYISSAGTVAAIVYLNLYHGERLRLLTRPMMSVVFIHYWNIVRRGHQIATLSVYAIYPHLWDMLGELNVNTLRFRVWSVELHTRYCMLA
jgi:hypothetical protein